MRIPNDMLFKENGVPSHFHYEVSGFLYWQFPRSQVSRGRSVIWLSFSPDQISIDFFLGVH